MSEQNAIHLEQTYPQPPGAVWKALTDPGLHARWWAAGDVRAKVGHAFSLDMGQWGMQPCEVLAVEPERLFRYAFSKGMLNTEITWRLQAEEGGTRLWLEQSGFELDAPMGKQAMQGMAAGWPAILQRLGEVLAGG